VTGLSSSTTYHYALVFTTEVGTVSGAGDQTLKTLAPPPPGAPDVETGAATNIAQTTATFNGLVNPVGGTLSDCHFEYGPGTAQANMIYSVPCSQTSISGTANVAVSANVTGLNAGQQWSFQLVAANPSAPVTTGALSSFTTLPDCGVTMTFNWVKVTGCLLDQNGVYTATPGTSVDVNGLTFNTSNDDDVVIDPATATIQSDNVAVGANLPKGQTQNGFGNILLYLGPIDWTVPAPSTSTNGSTVPIATLVLPQQEDGSTDDIDGMKMDGDLQVSFDKSDGADMSGNAWLNLPDWLTRAVGVTGAITFKTSPGNGLSSSSEKISEANWSLFGSIGVKNFNLTYDPVHDMWTGGASLVLPTPNQLTIAGTLSLEHGDFHSFSASVNNLNIPIADAVFLQEIGVSFGLDPLTLGGSAGFSFGPQVDNKSLVNVTGGFTYQAAYNNAPQLLQVTGQLSILWLKGANAYFDYYDPGGFRFGASFAPSISGVPLIFKVSLDGAISGSHFDLDGQASATLKYVDLSAGAEVLISDTGAVGCLHLSVLGFGWSPGAAYTWATHSWDLMGKGCSVAGWETLQFGQGSSSAAGGSRHITLPAGSDLLEVDAAPGAHGAPKVTLTGPDGQRVSTPEHSVKPYYVRGLQVLQDAHDDRTWIAVQHGGGNWTVTPEPGSVAIAKLRAAKLLPTPEASGQISGKGGRRTLTWKVTPIAGEKVTFWELGKGIARIIGSSRKSHGSLSFTPGLGAAGQRTVQADITIDGRPRTDIPLARFKASAPPKPAKPRKLTVKAAGGGVKISWAPAKNVQIELVRVAVSKGDGATLTAQVAASRHSVTITDVNPIRAATVTVIPQSETGEPGPAAVVHYPQGKPGKKK
jgi:hypothetical protein